MFSPKKALGSPCSKPAGYHSGHFGATVVLEMQAAQVWAACFGYFNSSVFLNSLDRFLLGCVLVTPSGPGLHHLMPAPFLLWVPPLDFTSEPDSVTSRVEFINLQPYVGTFFFFSSNAAIFVSTMTGKCQCQQQ